MRAEGPCSGCTARRSDGPLCVTRCDAAQSDSPPKPPLPLPLQGLLAPPPSPTAPPHPPSGPTQCWGALDIHPVHAHICARVCSPSVCVPPPPPPRAHACAAHHFWPGVVLGGTQLSPNVPTPRGDTSCCCAPLWPIAPRCAPRRSVLPHRVPLRPTASLHPHCTLLGPTVPHGAPWCRAVPACILLCPTVLHCVTLCPIVPSCAPLCPLVPSDIPLCPTVPHRALLCPPVSYCAPLCNTGPYCAPLCPITSCCALLCPLKPPVPHRAPSYPIVPSDIPLCSAAPYCLTAPCRAPLHPVVPHCSLSCPPVPLCGPTVHNPTPRCPAAPHCAPRSPPWCSGPPPAPHSSHSPAAIPPPRDSGTGPGWQGVVPSIPCAPPRRGPPPGHPAVPVTQALAVLPAKMEAAVLLQLWALAGKWQPQHQRGDTAGGTPWGGGWGDPQGLGVPMGELGKSVLSLGTGGVGEKGTGGTPMRGGSRVRGRGCPHPCPHSHSRPPLPPQHLLNIAATAGTRVLGAAVCAVGGGWKWGN